MMAQWWTDWSQQQEQVLTTRQTLELAKRDLEIIEKRVAFIEATLAAIRAEEPEEDT